MMQLRIYQIGLQHKLRQFVTALFLNNTNLRQKKLYITLKKIKKKTF